MLTARTYKVDDYYPVWGSWGEKNRRSYKHILVIDDDSELLKEIRETLNDEGYGVNTCRSGAFRIRQIFDGRPDLILLDLKMDTMHGLQLAAQLAEKPETSSIPIMAMTGYYTQNEISRFLSLGLIRACVSKPIQPEELKRKIEQLI